MDRLAGRLVERLRDDPDDPSVVGLDGEEADRLFDALGSETSRAVLAACYERGRTRSELSGDLETSIQNVGYHVDKLESAGLLEVVETRYGENGREVRVYEPSKRAVVVAAGEPGLVERLADALERLFAPVVLVGLLSMVATVLARGPEQFQFGLLADDAAPAAEPTAIAGEPTAGVVVGVAVFLLGVAVVLLGDRRGAFDQDRNGDRRTGRASFLLGRRPNWTRRTAAWSTGLGFGAFLALDLAISGPTRLATIAALGAILTIPLGVLLSAIHARADEGVLVSWLAASAPLAGLWGYLAAADALRHGLEPGLVAASLAVVILVGVPLGSIAYLLGRLLAWRRGDDRAPSSRTVAALAASPFVAALLVVGWLHTVS